MKPFLFLVLSMGVIYGQTVSAVYTNDDEDETGEEGDEDEDEDEYAESSPEEEMEFPSLICTLFGTTACNTSCLTVANIYGTDATGQCDDLQTCGCAYHEEGSLDDLWGRKFESKSVLPQIKQDEDLSLAVLEILKNTIKSSEETKREFKDVLSDDQIKQIRVKAGAPPNKIPQPDGKFDQNATKIFVNKKLKSIINAEFPKGIDYKKSLNEALENASDEYQSQHLIQQVRRTRNPTLISIIDEYLKSKQIKYEAPAEDSEKDISEFVDHYIINELIKATKTGSKPKPKPNSTSTRPNPPRPKKPPSKSGSSAPSQNAPNIPSTDFTLPDKTINKRIIDAFQTPVDKTWPGTNYRVRFKRESPKGDTELWWSKGNDHVYLHRHSDGSVDQNWQFGGKAYVGLYRDVDKTQIERWDFGQTRLEVTKSPNGAAYREWERNNSDEGSYHEYRQIIESWCKANEFFVGAESCVIF